MRPFRCDARDVGIPCVTVWAIAALERKLRRVDMYMWLAFAWLRVTIRSVHVQYRLQCWSAPLYRSRTVQLHVDSVTDECRMYRSSRRTAVLVQLYVLYSWSTLFRSRSQASMLLQFADDPIDAVVPTAVITPVALGRGL